jgi:hypothetical protein
MPDHDEQRDSMATGFYLVVLLHVPCQVVLALAVAVIWGSEMIMMPLVFLGWSQLVYMVPAIVWSLVRGRRRTATMLAILTAVGFLVTSACAALVMYSF